MYDSTFSPILTSFSETEEDYYPEDTTVLPVERIKKEWDEKAEKFSLALAYQAGVETDRYLEKVVPILRSPKLDTEKLAQATWSIGKKVEQTLYVLWQEAFDWGNQHAVEELNQIEFSRQADLAEFAKTPIYTPYPPDFGIPLSGSDLDDAAKKRTFRLANDVDQRTQKEIYKYVREAARKHKEVGGISSVDLNVMIGKVNLALGRQRRLEQKRPFPPLFPQQSEGGEQVNTRNRPPGAMTLIPRAELIAQTELGAAYNLSRLQVYRKAGIKYIRYTAVLDGRTSRLCRVRNGTVHELEAMLSQTRVSFRGIYDTSQYVLPAHPNCRSTWQPVGEGSLDKKKITTVGRAPGVRSIQKLTSNWSGIEAAIGVVSLASGVGATAKGALAVAQQEEQKIKNKAVRAAFLTGGAALSLSLLYMLARNPQSAPAPVKTAGKAVQSQAQQLGTAAIQASLRSANAQIQQDMKSTVVTGATAIRINQQIDDAPVTAEEIVDADLREKFPRLLASGIDLKVTTDKQLSIIHNVFGEDLAKLRQMQAEYEQRQKLPVDRALPPAVLPQALLDQYPELRDYNDLRAIDWQALLQKGLKISAIKDQMRTQLAEMVGMPYTPVDDLNLPQGNIANSDPEVIAETLGLNINQTIALQQQIQIALNNGKDIRLDDLQNFRLPRYKGRVKVSKVLINQIKQSRMLTANPNPNFWLFVLGGRDRKEFLQGAFGVSNRVADIMQQVVEQYGVPDSVETFVRAVDAAMASQTPAMQARWRSQRAAILAQFSSSMTALPLPALQPQVQRKIAPQTVGGALPPGADPPPAPSALSQGIPRGSRQMAVSQFPGVRRSLETYEDRVRNGVVAEVDGAISEADRNSDNAQQTLKAEVLDSKAESRGLSPKQRYRERQTRAANQKTVRRSREEMTRYQNAIDVTATIVEEIETETTQIEALVNDYANPMSEEVYNPDTGKMKSGWERKLRSEERRIKSEIKLIEKLQNPPSKKELEARAAQTKKLANRTLELADQIMNNPYSETFFTLNATENKIDNAINLINKTLDSPVLRLTDTQRDHLIQERDRLNALRSNNRNARNSVVVQEVMGQQEVIQNAIADVDDLARLASEFDLGIIRDRLLAMQQRLQTLPRSLDLNNTEVARQWGLVQQQKQDLKLILRDLRETKNRYRRQVDNKSAQWQARTQDKVDTEGNIVESQYSAVTKYHREDINGKTLHDGERTYGRANIQRSLLNWQPLADTQPTDYFEFVSQAMQHLQDLEYDPQDPGRAIRNTLAKLREYGESDRAQELLGLSRAEIDELVLSTEEGRQFPYAVVGRVRRSMIDNLKAIMTENHQRFRGWIDSQDPNNQTLARLEELRRERDYWLQQQQYIEQNMMPNLDAFKGRINRLIDDDPDLYNKIQGYEVERGVNAEAAQVRGYVQNYINDLDGMIASLESKLIQPNNLTSPGLQKLKGDTSNTFVNQTGRETRVKAEGVEITTTNSVPVEGRSYDLNEIRRADEQAFLESVGKGQRRRNELESAWNSLVNQQGLNSNQYEQVLTLLNQKTPTGSLTRPRSLFTDSELARLEEGGLLPYLDAIATAAQNDPENLKLLREAVGSGNVTRVRRLIRQQHVAYTAQEKMRVIESTISGEYRKTLTQKFGIDAEFDFDYQGSTTRVVLNFNRPQEINRYKAGRRGTSEDAYMIKLMQTLRKMRDELGTVQFEIVGELPDSEQVLGMSINPGRIARTSTSTTPPGLLTEFDGYDHGTLRAIKKEALERYGDLDAELDISGFKRYTGDSFAEVAQPDRALFLK